MTETETKPKRPSKIDDLITNFKWAWHRCNVLRSDVKDLQHDVKTLRRRVLKLEKLLEEPQPLKPS